MAQYANRSHRSGGTTQALTLARDLQWHSRDRPGEYWQAPTAHAGVVVAAGVRSWAAACEKSSLRRAVSGTQDVRPLSDRLVSALCALSTLA
jgi:hypothetical protein